MLSNSNLCALDELSSLEGTMCMNCGAWTLPGLYGWHTCCRLYEKRLDAFRRIPRLIWIHVEFAWFRTINSRERWCEQTNLSSSTVCHVKTFDEPISFALPFCQTHEVLDIDGLDLNVGSLSERSGISNSFTRDTMTYPFAFLPPVLFYSKG